MNSTYTPEVESLLKRVAEADLRYARKFGEHLVAQTKRGLLMLRYDATTKTYTVTAADARVWNGNKRGAVDALVAAYDVVEA